MASYYSIAEMIIFLGIPVNVGRIGSEAAFLKAETCGRQATRPSAEFDGSGAIVTARACLEEEEGVIGVGMQVLKCIIAMGCNIVGVRKIYFCQIEMVAILQNVLENDTFFVSPKKVGRVRADITKTETFGRSAAWSVEFNGRLRRYFSITDIGKEKLNDFIEMMSDFERIKKFILRGKNK